MRQKTGLTLLLLALSAVWLAVFSWPDQRLRLVFCDVGQGDATLIVQGQVQILIDAGPNEKVLSCLSKHMPFWDKQIELAIATHQQKDHQKGFESVRKHYQIISYYDNTHLVAGQTLVLEQVKLKVLYPKGPAGRILGASTCTKGNCADANTNAVVVELTQDNFKALFTSDIDVAMEKKITWEDIDVLKVAHHGSKYATSEEFLRVTQPETAVISVGKNSYGHPTAETLARLAAHGAQIYRTDLEGEIVITPDISY